MTQIVNEHQTLISQVDRVQNVCADQLLAAAKPVRPINACRFMPAVRRMILIATWPAGSRFLVCLLLMLIPPAHCGFEPA
jgi:hypothetical protein